MYDDSFKFVLGAMDPEMRAIMGLLRTGGAHYALARKNGKSCRSSDAYGCDATDISHKIPVLVECEPSRLLHAKGDVVYRVDHHNPGDAGYGVSYERFMDGSSLGQMIKFIIRHEMYNCVKQWYTVEANIPKGEFQFINGRWLIGLMAGHAAVVPKRAVIIAASDHCLNDAYAGRCAGVTSEDVSEWRLRSRALWQGVDKETLQRNIEKAYNLLMQASPVAGLDGVLDMREYGRLPEMGEAAAQHGISFMKRVPSTEGRTKISAYNLSQKALEQWPAWAAKEGLEGLYGGDICRGFVGGYLTEQNA